jgi:8-oxo-dGTP pyrophosphatase MutT (NUDIX family)
MPISSFLASLRAKVGHDLIAVTAASVSVFDETGRLLLGKDAETDYWTLPGGAIDPDELPASAAVRECWEETGLHVELTKLIGIFGGQKFRVTYPNGDQTYYTTIAFEAHIIGGALKPDGLEMESLQYFSSSECGTLNLSPSSRIISACAFRRKCKPFFETSTWSPD